VQVVNRTAHDKSIHASDQLEVILQREHSASAHLCADLDAHSNERQLLLCTLGTIILEHVSQTSSAWYTAGVLGLHTQSRQYMTKTIHGVRYKEDSTIVRHPHLA
jgi:hypothetical protein